MDIYQYQGRNKRGELLKGTIESPSPQAVAQWLRETEIFPLSISAQSPPSTQPEWFTNLLGENAVSLVDLLLFTRQISTMVRAGLPMMQAIEGIQKSTASKGLAKILQVVRADLDRGMDLSTAFSHHPKVFNEYYVSMVRVGEDSGRLEESFRNLHHQIDFDRQMKQKVKSALRYPTFVMIAIGIALAILTIFVIPVFAQTFKSLGAELPLLTRVLIGTSNFAVNFWWGILLMMGLLYVLIGMFLKSPQGRYRWDRAKLRLPIFGKIIVKSTIARFCRSFSTATKSGVPIVQAFHLVSRVVDNVFYEERILQMRQGVERGESLSRVMHTSGIFSPLELQMIAVGEETGEIDSMVEQIALIYQEDVEYEVSKLSQAIEPILLAVMGVLVGILLLGIFLPLWSLGQATMHPGR